MEEVVTVVVVMGGDLLQLHCWQTAAEPHLDLEVKGKKRHENKLPLPEFPAPFIFLPTEAWKASPCHADPLALCRNKGSRVNSVRCPPSTVLPAIWRCGNRAAGQPGGEAGEEAENTKRSVLFFSGGGGSSVVSL